jgi:hypothetical protein
MSLLNSEAGIPLRVGGGVRQTGGIHLAEGRFQLSPAHFFTNLTECCFWRYRASAAKRLQSGAQSQEDPQAEPQGIHRRARLGSFPQKPSGAT